MSEVQFTPGSLVSARGRDWMVLTGSTEDTLRVRPISGSEEDQTLIYLPLELEPVGEARFPAPKPDRLGGHDAALLLRDALVLSLRRGAGPLRSFGQIAVEPRAYQLVPLLLALKLDPIRLLVADDVGVGKTIEAALIARELLDRGDIERTTVLCPPHLVDQWVTELDLRFNIRAVAVTASSARRLERDIPPGASIFAVHHHTVVSLDYIKSQQRRDHFLHACPEFVIVDEAHTCASQGRGQHQRYELLKALSEHSDRHLVLLTATPHSGDDAAFYRLLGLLDPEYERLAELTGQERDALRRRLARNFVQRRRKDIEEWNEKGLFPKREGVKELTYTLTGAWESFFNAVLDYCAEVVNSGEGDELRQRLNFWGTLALLRCAASSPVAAVLALRTRAGEEPGPEEREELLDRIFDGEGDLLVDDDVEPPVSSDDPALTALIEQAEHLAGLAGDPKLKAVTEHVEELLAKGFNPVVFCRFIATAHYLGRHLRDRLKGVEVGVITGELTPDERAVRVARIGDSPGNRVLVATDCLSEGINLQAHFNAVFHYDLSWNPTRHEQREGRVDRFGQKSPTVRAALLYGANNPVDGAVLEVILRKAARIRKELGVPVPVPDEGRTLTQALLKAVLIRRGRGDPAPMGEQMKLFDARWEDARAKAAGGYTVFAQRTLRPQDVLPEWHRCLEAMGGRDDVQRFSDRALARLGSGLEPMRRGFKVATSSLPGEVRERLEAEDLNGTLLVDFGHPAAPGCRPIQRSHPLISILAETLLGNSLSGSCDVEEGDPSVLGRTGCWISAGVRVRTTVVLLRLRHLLRVSRRRRETTILVEESTALAWGGVRLDDSLAGTEALELLAMPPVGDPPDHVRAREATRAVELVARSEQALEALAVERAQVLLEDHERMREASGKKTSGKTTVEALPRPDVIGVYVLLPELG